MDSISSESKDRSGTLAAIGQATAAAIVGASFTAFFTLTKVEANTARDREQMVATQSQLSNLAAQFNTLNQRFERLATQVEYAIDMSEKPRRRDKN